MNSDMKFQPFEPETENQVHPVNGLNRAWTRLFVNFKK